MYSQLFGLLLFACQIIFNGSTVIRENSTSVVAETSTTSRPADLPADYVRFPDVHAAYKLHTEGATWNEARDRCIAGGAHLAIADTLTKIEHINSLRSASWEWIHVGFYHSNLTNEWVRVDNNRPATSIPWMKDNPDGTGDCVGIVHFENTLVDYSCTYPGFHYVCEVPI